MHIPDGFLDLFTCAIMYAISSILCLQAFRKVKQVLEEEHVPLMSLLTAGVFASQMLNFPIIGGTSGHLIGGTLVAIFLGPYAAIVSMSIILAIQSFVFADGGITALGANIFNMGVIAACSYYIYVLVRKLASGKRGVLMGSAIASWIAVVMGAVACGIEIGLSPAFLYDVRITVLIMVFWHVIIGVGEALITSSVVAFTLSTRPDLLELPKIAPGRIV